MSTLSTDTVRSLLALAQALGLERLDSQLLLAEALGQSRSWLISHDTDPLPEIDAKRARAWLQRRADDEPLAYLTGHKEFHGLRLSVSPHVLVPRPDTETLVEWALALLEPMAPSSRAPSVIDLGTGSGAIALALQHQCPHVEVHATDASPQALSTAQHNARQLNLPVQFHAGDWWSAIAGQRFDLAVSNPPYIAGDDPHLPALRHEPHMALTPGGDGLDAVRALIAGAPNHLNDGAWLLLEHGHDQADAVAELFVQAGFTQVQHRCDLADIRRCTGGCWPGLGP